MAGQTITFEFSEDATPEELAEFLTHATGRNVRTDRELLYNVVISAEPDDKQDIIDGFKMTSGFVDDIIEKIQ